MAYNTLKLDLFGEVATLTLNRPEKRNAISVEMIDDLLGALADIERSSCHAVILTGAGTAFCSGMDLASLWELSQEPLAENLEDSRRLALVFRRIWSFPKITIAAVNGPAIAAGCGLATVCDFTVAVPEAKFGYSEVRIGFLPAIVSVFLVRQIGERPARDLLLTGRIIDATEAQRLGLVTQIVPAAELTSTVQALADSLLAASPASLHKMKQFLNDITEKELDRELEAAVVENAQIRSTPDFREGITAFLEKRAPHWAKR